MKCKKLILSILLINLVYLTSCKQQVDSNNEMASSIMVEQPIKSKYQTKHPYGAWSCPDNFGGFPPVDVTELDKIPVVSGRLPTKEETQNGTSVMYFDTLQIPSARPLDITLPKLARYYSDYTKKNELVVIIQSVIADNDTVVGFRYLNGGNGSAYLGEVSFISEEEKEKLGKTPFVFHVEESNAPKEKIWEVITSPKYAKTLGAMFDKNAYVESDWKKDSEVHFKYEPDKIVSTGIITALWENMYIQVDYNFSGYHYCEKYLILENKESKTTKIHVAAGPYGEDIEAQKVVWQNWLQKVRELSEG